MTIWHYHINFLRCLCCSLFLLVVCKLFGLFELEVSFFHIPNFPLFQCGNVTARGQSFIEFQCAKKLTSSYLSFMFQLNFESFFLHSWISCRLFREWYVVHVVIFSVHIFSVSEKYFSHNIYIGWRKITYSSHQLWTSFNFHDILKDSFSIPWFLCTLNAKVPRGG